jgi:hypothetical protein
MVHQDLQKLIVDKFPAAVAVAWKLNEENFMKDISAINVLKLVDAVCTGQQGV